jgi:two-component system KDP operon response regulator KdpE
MRVLIVEDDAEICRATKIVLAHNGYASKCVSKMSECAGAVADFDPDFVILDLGLPDSNGIETLEAMYGLVDHHIPVIVFSAEPMWAAQCLGLGAQEYLVKGEFTSMDIPKALLRAEARHRLSVAIDNSKKAADGEQSWPGTPSTDPGKVGDRLLSLAGEIKLLAAGG